MTGDRIRSFSPNDLGDLVLEFMACTASQVDAAVDRCRSAQASWVRMPASARAGALSAAASTLESMTAQLAEMMVREVGKPIGEALGEAGRGVAILRYYSQQVLDPIGSILPSDLPTGLLMSKSYPYGVAGLITPWNFPMAIPLWKLAPALAAGNGAVVKPAPEATATLLMMVEAIAPHFPPGLIEVCPGGIETGRALIERADIISFTGSSAAGMQVAAAAQARHVPVQCELGGMNASIIAADVDVASVAAEVTASAVAFAGQKCTATSRILVVGDDRRVVEVQNTLADALSATRVGDPGVSSNSVGPVISAKQRDLIRDRIRSAVAAGARTVAAASVGEKTGAYVEPTLLCDVPESHELRRSETFGPVFWIERHDDFTAAAMSINQSPFGLVSSLYTADLALTMSALDVVETGMLRINAPTTGVDLHAPFGGERESSIGPKEQGKAALQFYSRSRTCLVGPPSRSIRP